MGNSSEHKSLKVRHRGHIIRVKYWVDYSQDKKIVGWSVSEDRDGTYDKTVKNTEYIYERLGGRSGLFGFGARPERSFHEMIGEAVDAATNWVNENTDKHTPPEPDEIRETLEIRGYEVTDT